MLRTAQGKTRPQDWRNHAERGIYVDINTAAFGLSQDSHFIAFVEGENRSIHLKGLKAVYESTEDGYRVYLRRKVDRETDRNGVPLCAATARKNAWHLSWSGFQW